MSKQNTWNIDLTKKVNIIIGKEYGKTTLLKALYSDASFSSDCPL
jgi:AAA15 family ATPase/GTPase